MDFTIDLDEENNVTLGHTDFIDPFPDHEVNYYNETNSEAPEDAETKIQTAEIAAQGEVDAETGLKCVRKVMMREETRYEEVMTCNHSYDERCHTSYVTSFEPHQEEECDEKFRKVFL